MDQHDAKITNSSSNIPDYIKTSDIGIQATVSYRGSSKIYSIEYNKKQIPDVKVTGCDVYYL